MNAAVLFGGQVQCRSALWPDKIDKIPWVSKVKIGETLLTSDANGLSLEIGKSGAQPVIMFSEASTDSSGLPGPELCWRRKENFAISEFLNLKVRLWSNK